MDETLITVRRVDSVQIVAFAGVLDFAASLRLRLTLYNALDDGYRDVIVDLSGVELLDASAVGVLLRVHKHMRQRSGRLRALGASGLVLRVLEITGAAETLCAHDPLESALPANGDELPVDTQLADPAHWHNPWGFEVTEILYAMSELPPSDPCRAELRNRAVQVSLPYAKRLARRFHGLGESAADLDQVAALGLVRAIDGYDPSTGTDFGAYALPTVIGELKRYFRDHGWTIRVPRRLQELLIEMSHARDVLAQQLRRSPSTADLARYLDVHEEQIAQAAVAARAYRPSSLFAPVGRDDGPTPLDRLGEPDVDIDTIELRESIQPLLRELSLRDKKIISMRFYGNMTQAQIAAELGISQMHVSRLLKRIMFRLRRTLLAEC